MLRKKNEAYKLIKNNIAKLAVIQKAADFSYSRLISLFLNVPLGSSEHLSGYKYFMKCLVGFQHSITAKSNFNLIVDHVKRIHLGRDVDEDNITTYISTANYYYEKENVLKNFIRNAYKNMYPITPEMTLGEVATRNQKLGKVSVKTKIGDVVNYQYFQDAPGFLMKEIQKALVILDATIIILLTSENLNQDIEKYSLDEKLQTNFRKSDSRIKNEIVKI